MYYIRMYIGYVRIFMSTHKLDLSRFSYSDKSVIKIVIMCNALCFTDNVRD